MINREKAQALRALIEKASAFLTDEEALEGIELYPLWSGDGIEYKVNDRVRYNEVLYKVLQQHTSQPEWDPTSAVSLFARVLNPNPDVISDWIQPDSTNPYMAGDKVRYNDKIWISTINNNVWAPGVYGWEETNE